MPTTYRNGPLWLRQRTIGECRKRPMQTSFDLMNRLQLESVLEGHSGCVNCLEWNQSGNLLASGSDDRNVIVWDAFKGSKQSVVQTGHGGNIFSVKFMPYSGDTVVATCASDGEVKLSDTLTSKNLMNCISCHAGRVKRLAVHQNEPHLVWSAGEDGYIMQYDAREEHVCHSNRPNNLIIDLKTINRCLSAKCIAVNPIREEMLAIGSNDIYNRLFDRRFLKSTQEAWNSCTAYFAPGHLLKSNNRSNHLQSFGTTYLAFSPNGSELLASVHAEQVYLFNTYEPWERYKSFDISLKPLLLDKEQNIGDSKSKLRPHLHWQELRKYQKAIDLPEEHRKLCNDAYDTLNSNDGKLTKEVFDRINGLLVKLMYCPELYRIRAHALINRGWRGDYYQALRDCCCALALKPLDYATINRLAIAISRLGDKEATIGLLEVIETIQREFGPSKMLQEAAEQLTKVKRESPYRTDSWLFEDSEFTIEEASPQSMSGTIRQTLLSGHDLDLLDFERFSPSMHIEQIRKEIQRYSNSYDYSERFCGHCNMNTDIKEASFFGTNGEFIVGGSDDGAFYIWDKKTANIVKAVNGDSQILNCVQPHPNVCVLATSGIESSVKLWSTRGKTHCDLKSLEVRCAQNQDFISADPLEAMIMMLYPDRDI